jgi:hypothetical protein
MQDIVSLNIGRLPAGKTITVTFEVSIVDPLPDAIRQVANQGQVSGTNFAAVSTDDPDTSASRDPTVTLLDPVRPLYLPLILARPLSPWANSQFAPRGRRTSGRRAAL